LDAASSSRPSNSSVSGIDDFLEKPVLLVVASWLRQMGAAFWEINFGLAADRMTMARHASCQF
jgi:hypothetical protein